MVHASPRAIGPVEGGAEGENCFALILRDLLGHGRLRRGRVAGACSELINAADVLDNGVAWMRANLI